MLNINPPPPIRGCVTAIFEDGPHTFNLTEDATLEALSARVAVLRRQRHGKLLDITVKFGATPLHLGAGRSRRTAGKGVRISA